MGFPKGTSGNPGGRTKIEKKIRDRWDALAKSMGADDSVSEWVAFVRGIMTNGDEAARDRLTAAKLLKEACYGAAKHTVVFDDEPEMSVEEYEAELAEIVREEIAKMPIEKRLALLAPTETVQ
jgi:hypothetical protein